MDSSVQNSNLVPQVLTWLRTDGSVENLTGYTITGRMYSIERKTSRAITGTLTPLLAANGTFTWTRSAADVADFGVFEVQFIGAVGASKAITYSEIWEIKPAR